MFIVVRSFLADQRGATAIEYALIASIVAIAIVQALTAMGGKLGNTYTKVGNTFRAS